MDLKLLFIIKSICSIVHMVTMEESNFRNFIRVANILSIKGRFNTAFFSELKLTCGCWRKRLRQYHDDGTSKEVKCLILQFKKAQFFFFFLSLFLNECNTQV